MAVISKIKGVYVSYSLNQALSSRAKFNQSLDKKFEVSTRTSGQRPLLNCFSQFSKGQRRWALRECFHHRFLFLHRFNQIFVIRHRPHKIQCYIKIIIRHPDEFLKQFQTFLWVTHNSVMAEACGTNIGAWTATAMAGGLARTKATMRWNSLCRKNTGHAPFDPR